MALTTGLQVFMNLGNISRISDARNGDKFDTLSHSKLQVISITSLQEGLRIGQGLGQVDALVGAQDAGVIDEALNGIQVTASDRESE